MLQEILEQLFEFTAKSIPAAKILEAKNLYQKETGEIYEDDKSYNTRMALFLEWYLFDNYQAESSKTILEALLEENPEAWNRDIIKTFNDINENIQGLFLVKKVKGASVKVLNLFTDDIYLVQEKDSGMIFRKNDIFQGRIIYFHEQYHFTGNFCFHPEKTHKFIKLEVRNITKLLTGQKNDLIKIENGLLKEQKILQRQEINISRLKDKIKNIDSESKIININKELKFLIEQKDDQIQNIKNLEKDVFIIKNDKIKIEGKKQINNLINRFSYMNLKWERSRQIDISDIYKN